MHELAFTELAEERGRLREEGESLAPMDSTQEAGEESSARNTEPGAHQAGVGRCHKEELGAKAMEDEQA